MTIEPTAGYLLVTFSDQDFRFRGAKIPGGAMAVIGGIKTMIPKEEREYDDETKVWSIMDSARNRKTLQELKAFYLSDPNQEKLF